MKKDKAIADFSEMPEDLLIRSKMEARSKRSIESIEKGEVHSLLEFRQMNRKWLKENTLIIHPK
jgi:hypothetical protein